MYMNVEVGSNVSYLYTPQEVLFDNYYCQLHDVFIYAIILVIKIISDVSSIV